MQTTGDLGPPKRVHFLTLIIAIAGLFIKNESRNLINFYNYLSNKIQL